MEDKLQKVLMELAVHSAISKYITRKLRERKSVVKKKKKKKIQRGSLQL